MQITWLVDKYIHEDELGRLSEAVKAVGAGLKVKDAPIYFPSLDAPELVMAYGSIEFIKQAGALPHLQPGTWCAWSAFDCLNIYPMVGGLLFNQDYIMLPAAEVVRRIDELMERFGGGVFLRPSGGDKSFSGFAVRKGFLELSNYWRTFVKWSKPNELVVVAGIKSIAEEWRVWVDRDACEVITASLYKRNGEHVYLQGCNGAVASLARAVSLKMNEREPFPDPIYTIDVCRTPNNGYGLMEVNSFSCSGLYEGDVARLVRRATEILTTGKSPNARTNAEDAVDA